jgi:two-component system sporulation sensor kinase A
LDKERFRQIIANLVGNALDAVPVGGVVRVESAFSQAGLTVEVSDNGPGIADDRLREVMKPFVSDKSTGTGLGLPLVKRIAEAHGGSLSLSSTPGGGIVASVFVPATDNTGRITWM